MLRTTGPQSRPNVLARTTTASGDDPLAPRRGWFAIARSRPRRTSPKRIGLLGLFGSGNSGNDGSLEAMVDFLRRARPDAELICFCQSSQGVDARISRDYGIAATPLALPRPANVLLRSLDNITLKIPRQLASLVRAIGYARRLDLLILPGTGILDDFQSGPLGMPLAIFGWCLAARLCGTRIAFVSIGAGPIHHPLSRWLMRSAVAMAAYRSYRNTISKTFMQSIGFDTRDDAVYPDIAFKLPAPPSPRRHRHDGLSAKQGTEDGPLTIGVGVMTYHGWSSDSPDGAEIYAAYLEKITRFVLWLLDRGHPVRILMGDSVDRQAVADVVTKVQLARPRLPQGGFVAEPIRSLHDLMRQIAETDVVVATRFHNIVCALKLGKPTVSIGYAPKNDVLMAEMGLGRFCQHIERLDLDLLIGQFTRLIEGRQSYEHNIRETNLLYQARLEHQDSLLAAQLL